MSRFVGVLVGLIDGAAQVPGHLHLPFARCMSIISYRRGDSRQSLKNNGTKSLPAVNRGTRPGALVMGVSSRGLISHILKFDVIWLSFS